MPPHSRVGIEVGRPDQIVQNAIGRNQAAYFDTYPGVWRHGELGGPLSTSFVISGRSDATLNPGGVRIGTAEIYRQVESIPEVLESLVVGQQIAGAGVGDERVVLFVRLREGASLTEALRSAIVQRIRTGTSPHHVPRVIVPVTDLPRTRSGKLSEIAVRDTIHGRAVKNAGALANPESLEQVSRSGRSCANKASRRCGMLFWNVASPS